MFITGAQGPKVSQTPCEEDSSSAGKTDLESILPGHSKQEGTVAPRAAAPVLEISSHGKCLGGKRGKWSQPTGIGPIKLSL